MEPFLEAASSYLSLALQTVAIVIVALGSIRALVGVARMAIASRPSHAAQRAAWLDYARWLVVALTFQLAADIVNTSFSASWDEVGRLAVIAVVRTFLSYFLDREMEHTSKQQLADRPGSLPMSSAPDD
jgi:uncharacterized membrane protein